MSLILKILIADDEPEARALLTFYLSSCKENIVLKEAVNGLEVLDFLEKENYDIIFLDIKMPALSGIEVLNKRSSSSLPAIIFTTAFDEYALPAFDNDAIDYLLKPFDQTRFLKAFQKALKYVNYIKTSLSAQYITQLTVKNGSKTSIIALSEIEFFEANGIYVKVVTKAKTYILNETMYNLEEKLPPSQFIRVHKSFIVHIDSVTEMRSLLNGDYMLILKSNKKIRASRTYRENLKKGIKKL